MNTHHFRLNITVVALYHKDILLLEVFPFAIRRQTMSNTCDLTGASLVVNGPRSECGNISLLETSTIVVSGRTTSNSVRITNAKIALRFADLSLSGPNPFTADNSEVSIVLSGANSVTSSGTDGPVIACERSSRLTFSGIGNGSLSVRTNPRSPFAAIGAAGFCDFLHFVNGNYEVSASDFGAGIGASSSSMNSTSIVRELIIENGRFVVSSSLGAAIGTGYSERKGRNSNYKTLHTSPFRGKD
jgi:hypothetical protein